MQRAVGPACGHDVFGHRQALAPVGVDRVEAVEDDVDALRGADQRLAVERIAGDGGGALSSAGTLPLRVIARTS